MRGPKPLALSEWGMNIEINIQHVYSIKAIQIKMFLYMKRQKVHVEFIA